MMRDTLKRLPRLTSRSLCMIVLAITLMLYDFNGSFFRVPMLILFIPWGCCVGYAAIQSYKGKLGLANGLLVASSAFLIVAALASKDLSQMTLYSLGGEVVAMLGIGIVPDGTDQETLRREMVSFAWAIILFLLPLMLLAVVSIFTGHPFMISGQRIGLKSEGNIASRVSVFANPNIGAQRALLCILLAIYALHASVRRWQRVLLLFSIAVFTIVLTHTQSRSCNIAMGIALGGMVFRGVYLRFHDKRWCIPAGLLAWGVMVGVTLALMSMLFWVDVHVAVRIAQAEDIGVSRIAAKGITGILNLTDNGRDVIWMYTYKFLKLHPDYLLIGTGAGDVTKLIGADFPDAAGWAHLHNVPLEILVRGGIPMLLCVFGFHVLLVRPCVRMLIAPETDGDRGLYVLPLIIGVLVAMMIAESHVVIRSTLTNLVYFLAVGRVFYADRRKTIGSVK